MREEILRQLRQVTEEEKKLLAGDPVDRTLYCSSGGFIIDSEKLLAKGQLIALRAHTRFADFPTHSHNYVEIMYMCSGQTVHRIEGNPAPDAAGGRAALSQPERRARRGEGRRGRRRRQLHRPPAIL